MKNCPRCQLATVETASQCLRCGAPLALHEAPLLVDGRYAIESELGRGAMGLVYLARDTGLDRRVALKFIAPRFVLDAKAVERFRREAIALASVRNEHIVEVYAFGRHEDSCFFAMEYIRGNTLESVIASHVTRAAEVPANLALSILARVSRGLGALHDRGLLHRDVKPANIVIEDRTGRPVLLDLGLVKPISTQDSRQTEIVGSPPYMAPEQILPARAPNGLSAAADVYALGCTAFELLTGSLPFDGGSIYETMHAHLTATPPLVSSLRPGLRDLDAALRRAMAKEPSERYASAADFAADIERVALRRESGQRAAMSETIVAPSKNGEIRLLIVDDDPTLRQMLGRAAKVALPKANLEVVHAESGMDAIKRVIGAPANLILLDYDMPGMNGVETLALLRNQPALKRTPAIVVTGHDSAEVRWRFSVLGVTEFLTKPASIEAIGSAILRSVM